MKIAKTVNPGGLQNCPLPKVRTRIVVNRKFSAYEIAHIKRGFTPDGSDDRWLIYFLHNRLYIHRSWTGFCIFVAYFKRKDDDYILHLIEVNRDPKQYAGIDDAYDGQLCIELIDTLLLHEFAGSENG